MKKPIGGVICKSIRKNVHLSWNLRLPVRPVTFSIYRKEEKQFTYGPDKEEYFLGVTSRGAERIFTGTLKATRERHFEFIDRTARVGSVYAYFIQVDDGVRTGPYPVKVRDPFVWWPYRYLVNRLEKLAAAHPRVCKLSWCGKTVQGNDIPLVTVGSGPESIMLAGTVHAAESGPELMVPVLEYLCRYRRDLLKKVTVVAVPSVNIDTREKMVAGNPWYLRRNVQGVDLNRNFPADWEKVNYNYGLDSSDPDSNTYRGPAPASAPETRALMDVVNRFNPLVVYSFHKNASICGFPANAHGARDTAFRKKNLWYARLYFEGMYPERQWDEKYVNWSSLEGCIKTWLYKKGKIPGFNLEGGVAPSEQLKAKVDKTDRAMIREYQTRHRRAVVNVMEHL